MRRISKTSVIKLNREVNGRAEYDLFEIIYACTKKREAEPIGRDMSQRDATSRNHLQIDHYITQLSLHPSFAFFGMCPSVCKARSM